MSASSLRIRGFDGLRAIAVLAVFLNHKTKLGEAVGPGGYGVRLFFVLSGFLIIGILHRNREAIQAGALSFGAALRQFYLNRAFRIWPVYCLACLALAVGAALGFWPSLKPVDWLLLGTFTTNFAVAHLWPDFPSHYGHLWSLAVEEWFYMWAAPAFLLLPARHHRTLCWAVIVVAVVAGLLNGPLGFPARATKLGFLTNFGLMALGGLAVLNPPQGKALNRLTPLFLLAFWAVPLISWRLGPDSPAREYLIWGSVPLVYLLLRGLAGSQGSLLVRLLDLAPLRSLGRVSYGFYVYHALLATWDFPWLVEHLHLSPPRALVVEFAMAMGLTLLSWFLVERPLLALRDRLLSPRQPDETRAAAAAAGVG